MNPLGTIMRTADGGYILHYERLLDVPAAKVWAALTDPDVLKNWLGRVEIEPRLGGKFVITFKDNADTVTGTILAFEPERLLAYRWSDKYTPPGASVRWTLSPNGAKACTLTLTHILPAGCKADDIVSFGAGWHSFLDAMLVAIDGGDGIALAYNAEAWRPLEQTYRDIFEQVRETA